MAQNKTVATSDSVADFIATVADVRKRAESEVLLEMMTRLSGYQPKMWGPALVGFGEYHYKYKTGREGDFIRIGFAPRKANLAMHMLAGFAHQQERLARLGKFKTGVSCLYVTRLANIDLDVLEEIIVENMAAMNRMYPVE